MKNNCALCTKSCKHSAVLHFSYFYSWCITRPLCGMYIISVSRELKRKINLGFWVAMLKNPISAVLGHNVVILPLSVKSVILYLIICLCLSTHLPKDNLYLELLTVFVILCSLMIMPRAVAICQFSLWLPVLRIYPYWGRGKNLFLRDRNTPYYSMIV